MACSSPSCNLFFNRSSIPVSTSATGCSLSFSNSIFCGYHVISGHCASSTSRIRVKFEKFQGEPPQDSLREDETSSSLENFEEDEEDDRPVIRDKLSAELYVQDFLLGVSFVPKPFQVIDGTAQVLSHLLFAISNYFYNFEPQVHRRLGVCCLPPDLEGAVRQSSEATAVFVSSGGMRAIVELLIPQLQFLDDEGAQVELWELSRIFLDTLIKETECQSVKAIFPDAGAAALLKYRWKDAAFKFASLSDRRPVESEDEIIVMVVPDYQMLEYVERIASDLSNDPPRPLIMWNPRLISEDVGVGVNVRKLRRYFLSTFTTVYSLRPLPSGAVFRCYPGLWKVFYDDKDRPNRYLLAKEFISRPDAEELELIFGSAEEKSVQGPNLLDKAAGLISSINRFMKAIS